MEIRLEGAGDSEAIREVNLRAFGEAAEADLVERLRVCCDELLSLVAEDHGEVIGHLQFSPVALVTPDRVLQGVGLAPMAVLPAWQRQGVGTALVREGLRRLRERHCPFVVVIGHPDFYPRFGFDRCSRYGIRCPWPEVPDEAFMVVLLDDLSIRESGGTLHYCPEFDQPEGHEKMLCPRRL
ncbi:MAG TPA: N-acetyltransferase [Gammaproteobacteria bacterium]